MPLFDKVAKGVRGPGQQVTPEMQREVGSIKSDPGSYLKSRGYSIPDGMTDPKEITVHLLKTGQVGSSRLQQIFGMK